MLCKLALIIAICMAVLVILSIIIITVRENMTDLSNVRHVPVYASFTSIPPRLNNTERIIKSLLNQTYPIEGIIFNIPKGTFKRTGEDYFVPEYLDKYKDEVKVVRCKEYGPATKIMGGLEYIPDDVYIYVLDDDMKYPKNHLERLVSHLDDDTDVVSNTLCYYNTVIKNRGICGYSGYIVHSDILADIDEYFNKLPKECFYVDDIWVSNYLQKKNAKFKFGDLLDNLGMGIRARIKDLFKKDSTSLFNTENKGNINILSKKK